MKIYKIEDENGKDIQVIHIREFAEVCGRSIQSTRHLLEDGNIIRKMKYYRDRSRLMIPVAELLGYPFVAQGASNGDRDILHYVKVSDDPLRYEKKICLECTFGDGCALRKKADGLVIPEGDK